MAQRFLNNILNLLDKFLIFVVFWKFFELTLKHFQSGVRILNVIHTVRVTVHCLKHLKIENDFTGVNQSTKMAFFEIFLLFLSHLLLDGRLNMDGLFCLWSLSDVGCSVYFHNTCLFFFTFTWSVINSTQKQKVLQKIVLIHVPHQVFEKFDRFHWNFVVSWTVNSRVIEGCQSTGRKKSFKNVNKVNVQNIFVLTDCET